MARKSKDSSANRTYDDIQPLISWRPKVQPNVVLINLPGFEKQQLKILLDSIGKMTISGERPESGNRWQRFRVDLQVDPACDLNAIRATFDKSILTVTMPAAKRPPAETPEEAAGTLACEYRPESRKHGGGMGSFVYGLNRPKRVAMGVMVAASLVAGIYAIYKFKIFQPKTGE